MAESPTVAIVGAGMAGLAAAHYLAINHIDFEVYETSDRPGGRVATDHIDGLTLDRGFQIVLEDYPELRRLVSVAELPLHRLYPGVYLQHEEEPLLLSDPRRVPGTYRQTLATLTGLMRLPNLRSAVHYLNTQHPTIADLGEVLPLPLNETVFAPLFRGVTLDSELSGPASFAFFILRRFLNGYASLPTEGMAQLPAIIAGPLRDHIHYHHKAISVASGQLIFDDGTTVTPDWIVLAVDAPALGPLLDLHLPAMRSVGFLHTLSNRRLFGVPAVELPTRGSPIYTIAPMSDIAPSYVNHNPERHLITASCDPTATPAELRAALALALNCSQEDLEFIEFGVVEAALPRGARTVAEVGQRVLLAGDHVGTPSLNSAIESGRQAAERIIRAVRRGTKEPGVDG
ncbi:FAD-dependent oxidoreductase [Ferrimicrobium sp.]|uniref:FAD-dependent oxidoreductase n=1 Tax=Ferrimicrobium sp. TaxID=2926050 RepID=UPI00261BCB18|nr:FAD-dependent oxidoreductase [Ferrimicrobium sp.]